MASTLWTTLYLPISSQYEGYYGKSSNDMYELTPEKAEQFLEDCEDLYTDIRMKMMMFGHYEVEGEYFRNLHSSLDNCVDYIHEYLEKQEKISVFLEVSGLPRELELIIMDLL
jgi:hypothetical protein